MIRDRKMDSNSDHQRDRTTDRFNGEGPAIRQPKPVTLRPAAFTIIELLMAIIIVGILAAILLVAISRGMRSAKQARTVTEIDQLQTACETYRTEHGPYPATLGEFVGETVANKQIRIMRHVAKAFPRYTGDYTANANANFKNDVALATQYVVLNTSGLVPGAQYNSVFAGAAGAGLNVDNLDPAETLVFWLGGLPDPTSETKLAGFRADPSSPFVYPTARTTGFESDGTTNVRDVSPQSQGQRTQRMFPFDPKRLVDYDQDGWFEYLPAGGTFESNTPPFVYFDSQTYLFAPAYPYPFTATGNSPTGQGRQADESLWGNVIPYFADPATATSPKFVNSTKFQILSGGMGNSYSSQPIPSAAYISGGSPWYFVQTAAPAYPKYFPSGTNFSDADDDNLTNFARGPLSEEAPTP